MLPYFVLDQFNLGPLTLYSWGLFVGLGFSAGYLLLLHSVHPARDNIFGGVRKKDLAPEKIAGLALAIFFGGALGAKILSISLAPGGFFNNLNLIFSQHSGAAFMGGLAGAILFSGIYIKLVKLNFWEIADLLVLPTALGIGISRIGCILINDHQGSITSLPWGISWPGGLVRHPVAIYEALVGFGLLAAFFILRKYLFQNIDQKIPPNLPFPKGGTPSFSKGGLGRIFEKPGQLFLLFLISYSAIRFFLEFTRVASGPLADPRWGILSVSQWVAVVVFIASLALFIHKKKC